MTPEQRQQAIKSAKEMEKFWNDRRETKADFDKWYDAIDVAGDRDNDDEPAFVARVWFSDRISIPVLGAERQAYRGKWHETKLYSIDNAPGERFARVTFGEKKDELTVHLHFNESRKRWDMTEVDYFGERIK
jgi:hypothetical protein